MCKQEKETALHILFDCPFLERKRFALLQPGKNWKGTLTLDPRYCNLSKEQISEDDDSTSSDGAVQ
ncbi:hypothetical protein C0J52_00262 [Blattella germanica]|nr:hypothetical protein C0J52_00262 [Blattella germanica]